jgi:anaerobic ribonucleoside-triphosphate reductase activating protein
MLPFEGGRQAALTELVDEIRSAAFEHGIEGITLLGGEPLVHAAGASLLAAKTRDLCLSVMVFSGYMLDQARRLADPAVARLLALTDILVDGPYDRTQPEARRRWIGSANQSVHFLTDRYRADDTRWLLPNTIEIRLTPREVTVNGFPTLASLGFKWKSDHPREAHQ